MHSCSKSIQDRICSYMGSCFGCCTKPILVTADDAPSKVIKIQGPRVLKPGISEDLWSTSTCDKDNSTLQSQRSMSSISTSNPSFDLFGNTGSTSNPSEYVNHGILLWNQARQLWTGNKRLPDRKEVRKPKSSLNATPEIFLTTGKPFPQRMPLSEMVDFLVVVWEQEGLYD